MILSTSNISQFKKLEFLSNSNLSSNGAQVFSNNNILVVSTKRRSRSSEGTTNQTFQLDVSNGDMNIGQVDDIISNTSIQTQPSYRATAERSQD